MWLIMILAMAGVGIALGTSKKSGGKDGLIPIDVPPPGPPPGTPGADPPMPPDLLAAFNALMQDPNANPAALEALAVGADLEGFHEAAKALRKRAAELRAGGKGGMVFTPPEPPINKYTIKSGDNPSALARKFTGDGERWPELLESNPKLHIEHVDVPTVTKAHPEGEMIRTTLVKPFNPGQILTLPDSWPAKPL